MDILLAYMYFGRFAIQLGPRGWGGGEGKRNSYKQWSLAHFRIACSLSIKARPGAHHPYANEFNLHVNEISFSYERVDMRKRLKVIGNGQFYT